MTDRDEFIQWNEQIWEAIAEIRVQIDDLQFIAHHMNGAPLKLHLVRSAQNALAKAEYLLYKAHDAGWYQIYEPHEIRAREDHSLEVRIND